MKCKGSLRSHAGQNELAVKGSTETFTQLCLHSHSLLFVTVPCIHLSGLKFPFLHILTHFQTPFFGLLSPSPCLLPHWVMSSRLDSWPDMLGPRKPSCCELVPTQPRHLSRCSDGLGRNWSSVVRHGAMKCPNWNPSLTICDLE